MLAVLASVLDRSGAAWFQGHPLYVFRECGQAGLAQGLLALPSLATAIAVATRSWWWQQAARLFLASSFQVLLWYSWTAAAPARGADAPNRKHPPDPTAHNHRASDPARPDSAALHPARRLLLLAAAAAGCLLSVANALRHSAQPPPPSSPQLLLPGSVFELPRDITASAWALQAALLLASAPALDHAALALPRSFTPGEAAILTQALLALGAGGAAYVAGACRQGLAHVLWSPHVAQPDPGMHVPAFCMLVLCWALLLAACAATAGAGAGAGRDGAGAGGAAAVKGASAAASAATTSSAGLNLRQRRPAHDVGPKPLVRASALREAMPPAVDAGTHGGAEEGLERLVAAATRCVAAAGAVLSLAMLVDLALWVLGRFVAASSQPRLATLAYWFGCLAVAVPFMYTVSRASAARAQQQREHLGQRQQEQLGEVRLEPEDEQQREQRRSPAVGGTQRGGPGAGRPGATEPHDSGPVEGSAAPAGNGHAAQAAQAPRQSPAARGQQGSQHQRQRRLRAGRWWKELPAALFRLLGVPHIVMRKGYHLLAIVLFLPAFGWDVRMLQASLAVAGAVLVAAEGLRCLGPAAVRAAIGDFMADFADARDSGPIYVTHFTLLLGIAVPVWLGDSVCGAAAGAMMAGLYGREAAEPMALPPPPPPAAAALAAAPPPPLSAAAARLLPSCRAVLGLSGLVSLGSGDTAAACVGFLLGRRRLFPRGSRKTWEGTLSGAAAMLGSWAVVVWWMDVGWALSWRVWGVLAGVTAGVAMLEAVTQQLDNVVVPIYYLTHLVLTMTGN